MAMPPIINGISMSLRFVSLVMQGNCGCPSAYNTGQVLSSQPQTPHRLTSCMALIDLLLRELWPVGPLGEVINISLC